MALKKGILAAQFATQSRYSLILELIVSLIVIGSALFYLTLFVQVKATTSLENDELYTIMFFSSKGVIHTLTNYHVANNHIFFNFLNALTPTLSEHLYVPLRARLWSFIAVGASLILALMEFFRRRRFFEGALFFQLIAVNYGLLDWTLKARGYGILAFCALATSLVLWRYLEQPRRQQLVIISLLTFIGTWTVPTYVFWGGTILLILFLWTRRLAIFYAGLITALTISLVYSPVINQLMVEANSYDIRWGKEYETVKAVFDTVKLYLLHPSIFGVSFKDWSVFVLLFSVAVIPYVIWQHQEVEGKLARILSLSVWGVFAVSLAIETVTIRTVSFITMPLALCALLIFSYGLRHPRLNFVSPFIYTGLGLFLVFHNIQQAKAFQFTPLEDWIGTAKQIEQTYPTGMPIYSTLNPHFLRVYLSESYPIIDQLDKEAYTKGQIILVENDWVGPLNYNQVRLNPFDLSAASTQVLIPQIRGNYQHIAVTPPLNSHIVRVVLEDLELGPESHDRNIESQFNSLKSQSELTAPFNIHVYLEPNITYRSFFLIFRNGNLPDNVIVLAGLGNDDLHPLPLEAVKVHRDILTEFQQDLVILYLDDREVDHVQFIISPTNADHHFSVSEMWAYPSSWSSNQP